jgi:hypothetical protein
MPRISKVAFHAVAIATIATLSTPALADNSASAFTGNGNAVIGIAAADAGIMDESGYVMVLNTELKNSGTPKDLVIGLSFETSLFTKTVVRSKGGKESKAVADAKIEMYVTVDDAVAQPGSVVFDRRTQELWASLGGILDCWDQNDDGIVSFDECNITEEEIGLILDTTAAHSFNFLAYDIGSGSHTVKAYARLSHNGDVVTDSSNSTASASLGKGTLSVWEVHGSVGN